MRTRGAGHSQEEMSLPDRPPGCQPTDMPLGLRQTSRPGLAGGWLQKQPDCSSPMPGEEGKTARPTTPDPAVMPSITNQETLYPYRPGPS